MTPNRERTTENPTRRSFLATAAAAFAALVGYRHAAPGELRPGYLPPGYTFEDRRIGTLGGFNTPLRFNNPDQVTLVYWNLGYGKLPAMKNPLRIFLTTSAVGVFPGTDDRPGERIELATPIGAATYFDGEWRRDTEPDPERVAPSGLRYWDTAHVNTIVARVGAFNVAVKGGKPYGVDRGQLVRVLESLKPDV